MEWCEEATMCHWILMYLIQFSFQAQIHFLYQVFRVFSSLCWICRKDEQPISILSHTSREEMGSTVLCSVFALLTAFPLFWSKIQILDLLGFETVKNQLTFLKNIVMQIYRISKRQRLLMLQRIEWGKPITSPAGRRIFVCKIVHWAQVEWAGFWLSFSDQLRFRQIGTSL